MELGRRTREEQVSLKQLFERKKHKKRLAFNRTLLEGKRINLRIPQARMMNWLNKSKYPWNNLEDYNVFLYTLSS